MTPERKQYYASGLMIRLISQVSQHFQELHRAKSPVLIVNALSRRGGGPLGSHSSHQNGLDADIVYLGEDKWQSVIVKGRVKDDFDYALNYDFFKILTETGFVNRIFVDSRIKRGMCQWVRDQGLMETEEAKEVLTKLRSWSGHDDHFHLRLVCSPFYPRCRDQTLPQGLGCPK